jgi:hypothetical protein
MDLTFSPQVVALEVLAEIADHERDIPIIYTLRGQR